MLLRKILLSCLLSLALGPVPASFVIASDTPASSTMADYIDNARTPEDHEYIASQFEQLAARAQSVADSYTNPFTCRHSHATALQMRGVRFPDVTAQRHCRAMMRQYTEQAQQLRELADYHQHIAEQWRGSASTPVR